MDYQTHTLSNGVRLIHKPDNNAVTYCGIVINTVRATKLKTNKEWLTLLNTCCLRGTAKRRSGHIINRLEHVGGELNAFTSKEETVVYAACVERIFRQGQWN